MQNILVSLLEVNLTTLADRPTGRQNHVSHPKTVLPPLEQETRMTAHSTEMERVQTSAGFLQFLTAKCGCNVPILPIQKSATRN